MTVTDPSAAVRRPRWPWVVGAVLVVVGLLLVLGWQAGALGALGAAGATLASSAKTSRRQAIRSHEEESARIDRAVTDLRAERDQATREAARRASARSTGRRGPASPGPSQADRARAAAARLRGRR